MVVGLSFLWARNIGMDGDPSTGEDCRKATPDDAPNRATMGEVATMIWLSAVRRNWAGVDSHSLSQVVEEDEKQHWEEQVEKNSTF